MHLDGRQVLVLGLGESGLAMARWCARRGARVRIADTRSEPPFKAALEHAVPTAQFIAGEFRSALLQDCHMIALSPGLSGDLPIVAEARSHRIQVTGEIELFAQGLADLGVRDRTTIIAITGTNGKTTTTALTGHLCRTAGKRVAVAGNISPAALQVLMECEDARSFPDIWVLELSSFQLETLESLDANAATVLNISDDHLDRYRDLDAYAAAKARIFEGSGIQVLNRQDARVAAMMRAGRTRMTFGVDAPPGDSDYGLRETGGLPTLVRGAQALMPLAELPLAGLHNAANALAALALCDASGLDVQAILPGLRSFKGLAHRVERVAEIGGVVWYDDSKGTNVGATVAALDGLGPTLVARHRDAKIVLIVGGDGKGQDFGPLAPACARHARLVILIGRDGPRIGDQLHLSNVPTAAAPNLDAAVGLAAQAAQPGDAVLLSPACASFDMFRNYEHRAQVFVDAVHALERTAA